MIMHQSHPIKFIYKIKRSEFELVYHFRTYNMMTTRIRLALIALNCLTISACIQCQQISNISAPNNQQTNKFRPHYINSTDSQQSMQSTVIINSEINNQILQNTSTTQSPGPNINQNQNQNPSIIVNHTSINIGDINQQQPVTTQGPVTYLPGNSIATGPPGANPFQLKIIHHDTLKDVIYVSLLPVEPPNEHEPRIELRSQFQVGSRYPYITLDERAPNDTFVVAVVVSDPDPGPRGQVDVSIDSGNEAADFKLIKLVTASNLYSVLVNRAPLSRARCQEYNLNIVAKDRGLPPKSSSLNLVIKINATSSSSQTNGGAIGGQWSSTIPASVTGPMLEPIHMQHSKHATNELIDIANKLVSLFIILVFLIMLTCALVHKSQTELKKTVKQQRKNLLTK